MLEKLWEQFDNSIHCKSGLNDTKKLMYLQDALKDGLARLWYRDWLKRASYEEAIKCLKKQYDRPRWVQMEHIRIIVDAVPIKNCSDEKFCWLYDVVTQHDQPLTAAKNDSF